MSHNPFEHPRFPRANGYDPDWIASNQMGPNALWLLEWLLEVVELEPGMRVLDMGCGRAMTSIFLARELGVTVFANDLWIEPTDNWKRIQVAGVSDRVFPIQAEAHALPYASGFFDAIVSLDAYHYFGTNDLYLTDFSQLVRPGGVIGVVVPGLTQPLPEPLPEHLTCPQSHGGAFWEPECWTFHTAAWWARHWRRSGCVEVEHADVMPEGCALWLQHEKAIDGMGRNRFPSCAEALEADGGEYLGFVRVVGRRPARD